MPTVEWMAWLGAAFTLGLLGSGHCLGMCGGIASALGLSVRGPDGVAPPGAGLLFSAGRITAYGLLGAFLGGFGEAAQHVFGSGWPIRVMAGGLVVLFGLHTMGVRVGGAGLERLGLRVWRRLSALGNRVSPRSPAARALLLGGLWGFLPCGLVYSAGATSIATGSALTGGLFMVAFGVGTLPAMGLATSAATGLTRSLRRPMIRRFAGSLLVALGVFAIWTALPGRHAPHAAGAEAEAGHAHPAHPAAS